MRRSVAADGSGGAVPGWTPGGGKRWLAPRRPGKPLLARCAGRLNRYAGSLPRSFMSPRILAGAAYVAACLAVAPAARSQAAPTTVRAQPVNSSAMHQTLTIAQTMSVKPMPAAAAAAHAKVSPKLSAPAKSWVQSEARVITGRNLSPSAMVSMAQADAKSRFAGQGLSGMDIDALVQMVMFTCAQDAQNDLKDQLAQMQKANQQKQAQRAAANAGKQQQAAIQDSIKDHQDQLGDMSQEMQMRMQMSMDRMSKAEEALSNIMKKNSDTANSIISNLK